MTDASGAGQAQGQTPAGWYTVDDHQRYWDGAKWTDHVAPITDDAGSATPTGQPAGSGSPTQTGAEAQTHVQTEAEAAAQSQAALSQPAQGQADQEQSWSQAAPQDQQGWASPVQGQQGGAGQQGPGQQSAQGWSSPAPVQNQSNQWGSTQGQGQSWPNPGGAGQQNFGGPASSDDKSMAMIAHFGGILGFLAPLIIWLMKKDESPFVKRHAQNALNFQLTLAIGYVISWVLVFVFIGLLFLAGIFICSVIFSVLGGMAAQNGQDYEYPVVIPFVS